MKFSELLVEYLDLVKESDEDFKLWGQVSHSREKRKQEVLDAMDTILESKRNEDNH